MSTPRNHLDAAVDNAAQARQRMAEGLACTQAEAVQLIWMSSLAEALMGVVVELAAIRTELEARR